MSQPELPSLCLCMIVKNETRVLPRCFGSLAPYIDYWVISDTGSTDGTQAFIRDYFAERDIAGELFDDPWVDFGANRTTCLRHAKGKAKFLLMVDADEHAVVSDPNFVDTLETGGGYMLEVGSARFSYKVTVLLDGALDYTFKGVTHEYLQLPQGAWHKTHTGLRLSHSADGANRSDKFTRDIRLLTKGLKDEPRNARYHFYLGESYRNNGQPVEAELWYRKRVALGGWAEEVYYAMYRIADCMEQQARRHKTSFEPDVLNAYLAAFRYRPTRLEAIHRVVRHYRTRKEYAKGIAYGMLAYPFPSTFKDVLFVEKDVHDYKLRDELAICACYVPAMHLFGHELYASDRFHVTCTNASNRSRIVNNAKLLKERAQKHVRGAAASLDMTVGKAVTFPTHEQTTPPRKHLVFTSAGDTNACHERWCTDSDVRTYDVWVVYYGDDRARYDALVRTCDRVEHRKGSKFQNFHHVYRTHRAFLLDHYERFFVVDDDIVFDTTPTANDRPHIEKLFALSVEHDLWLCQPAFVPPSKVSHEVTKHQPDTLLRYTNFVEVNTPVIARDVLDKCMRAYDPRLVGWGIDFLFVWALGRDERARYAVVDAVTCVNPDERAKGGARELMNAHGARDRAQTWAMVAREKDAPASWMQRVWQIVHAKGNACSSLVVSS